MSDSERWQTPPEIFDPLMHEFNFDLDAAADPMTHRTEFWMLDCLRAEDWPGEHIWMNPPYGRKLEPFVRRACKEAFKGRTIVALIQFRCRAAWWHDCVIDRAMEVRCVRKRIKFIRLDGTHAKHTGTCDSCVVVWRGKGNGTTRLISN